MSERLPKKRDEKYAREILEHAASQVLTGGDLADGKPGGPYWPKEAWQAYMKRLKEELINECGYSAAEAQTAIDGIDTTGLILTE